MQNMKYYYDFSGQKFGYPLSLSINSFSRQVFSRHSSLEITYVLKGEYEVITENFSHIIKEHELVIIAPNDIHIIRPNSKAYTTAFKELYGIVPSHYRKKFVNNMKFNEDKKEGHILCSIQTDKDVKSTITHCNDEIIIDIAKV